MSDKDVEITTKDECGTLVIDAPPMTVVRNNNKVKFDNQLDSATADPDDGVDAYIQFYMATDTGNIDVSAEDFCDGYSGGNLLLVEANKKYDCEVLGLGAFKYDVAADGYTTLDPVIIVEAPPITRDLPDVWILVAAVALSGLTYYFGFRSGSKQE